MRIHQPRMMVVTLLVSSSLLVTSSYSQDTPKQDRQDIPHQYQPPKFMMNLYHQYNRKGGGRRGYVRSILPCNGPGSLSVQFCHQTKEGNLQRAELHLRTRKLRAQGEVTALMDLETGTKDSKMLAVKMNSRRGKWAKFDISTLLEDTGGEEWRLNLEFQLEEERGNNGTRMVRRIKPRLVARMADTPFIVLYSDDEPSSFEEEVVMPHRRQKRFVEIKFQPNDVYHLIGEENNDINAFNNKINPAKRKQKVKRKKMKKTQFSAIPSGHDYEEDDDEILMDYEKDDLSEFEIKEYQFIASDKKNSVLPYPKWWDKKKNKRRNNRVIDSVKKKDRQRKKENETIKKILKAKDKTVKWNTLPKIWRSFGKQVGAGQSLAKDPNTLCNVQTLEVNLREVGWGKTVISPVSYQANYCEGSCSFPLSQAENPTNHATVLSILARKNTKEAQLPEACCVPRKMESLTLLYFDTDGSVVLKTFPQMAVKSCGCR